MDPFKKLPINTFDEIEREFGRMLRNMSMHRMLQFRAENIFIATDVYETVNEFIVYMEVPRITSYNVCYTKLLRSPVRLPLMNPIVGDMEVNIN